MKKENGRNIKCLFIAEFNGRCNWRETLHRRHECKSHYAHEYSFPQVGPTTMQVSKLNTIR